jgi:DNA-binding NarL/FixJ family response regulator
MVLLKDSFTSETNDKWVGRIGHALRNLDDRSALNRSSLSRLTCIEKIAKEKYNGRILPRGLALRDILLSSVDKVISDMSQETASSRACQYLELLKQGLSCQQISGELGLSREHVSRVYRRKALELVTSAFLTMVKRSQ